MDRVVAIRFTILTAVTILLAGCYDRFDTPPANNSPIDPATITIGDLNALYRNESITIESDMVIVGRVTSSDQAGNFHYSFMVEDSTGAVEVMAKVSDLHNTYPVGSLLSISLNGLALGESNSVKQIGMPPAAYSYYPTEYIPSMVELNKRIKRSFDGTQISPITYHIPSLDHSLCGRLVRINDLRIHSESDMTWGSDDIFIDSDDNRIAVYVREYADFAGKPIPTTRVSITGILQYGRTTTNEDLFIIKICDENDCVASVTNN